MYPKQAVLKSCPSSKLDRGIRSRQQAWLPRPSCEINRLPTTKPARKHFGKLSKRPHRRISERSGWHIYGTLEDDFRTLAFHDGRLF